MMAEASLSQQDAMRASLPHILVVIPTRDRPADLGRCLESLALVAYPSWELLIVDQSVGDASRQMAETCRDRLPKLTYERMRERGQCRGRNVGLERAGAGIVAYLDDDCTVDPGWLADVAGAFRRHPSATLVFGSVHAAPHDPEKLLIPVMLFERERVVAAATRRTEWGMGASMYLWPARSSHRHRFDVHLGPGTRWPAADDWDYAIRVALAGDPVVLTPAIRVCHHGARSLEGGAARRLVRGYAHGVGAMDMKMIRCGDMTAVWRALEQIRSYLSTFLLLLAAGKRPSGLGRLAMYVRGLAESFLLPVDQARCLYVASRHAAMRR